MWYVDNFFAKSGQPPPDCSECTAVQLATVELHSLYLWYLFLASEVLNALPGCSVLGVVGLLPGERAALVRVPAPSHAAAYPAQPPVSQQFTRNFGAGSVLSMYYSHVNNIEMGHVRHVIFFLMCVFL